MESSAEIEKRLARLNEKLGHYISPRDKWTHVDEALYGPVKSLCAENSDRAIQFSGNVTKKDSYAVSDWSYYGSELLWQSKTE